MAMRRSLLLAFVLVLALPVAALADKGKRGDGTLEIRDARGKIELNVNGSLIARINKGKVRLRVGDDEAVTIKGRRLRHRKLEHGAHLYVGKRIRVTIVDTRFRMRIVGVGINMSAVARGRAVLDGSDTAADVGEYSLNGAEWESIPLERTAFRLVSEN
jgi:hypothetical protein